MDAAKGYKQLLDHDGKMMITLAGAMSTAELGKSLAHMIREDKVHIICCTGANLEEDIFNLVAHNHYRRVPDYRDLTPADEKSLLESQLNRVTDTCIPEEEAMRSLEHHLTGVWSKAANQHQRYFPHEYIYQLLESGVLQSNFQKRPAPMNHWVLLFTGICCSIFFIVLHYSSPWQWVFLLTLPLLFINGKAVQSKTGGDLDPYLKHMSLTTLVYVLTFGLGLVMASS